MGQLRFFLKKSLKKVKKNAKKGIEVLTITEDSYNITITVAQERHDV